MAKLYQPELIELSNGIPVVLQHYETPVAATYWWVKVGSADEAPQEAGFAHFLEHMLFKDASAKETGIASTGQMARMIESLGGEINAYTSFDQTVYHVTSAAEHWEKVIDAFGTMAKPQKFFPKDFEREREVILEELRKNEDSPGRQLFQNLFSKTFSKHPYGKPVIGFVKTLKAAKVQQLESFYRRNYVPSKMGLILVGPILDKTGARKKAIISKLEKFYGQKVLKKEKKVTPSLKRPVEPSMKDKSTWMVHPFDVKTPSMSFSFRVPDLAHEDLPALDLLSSILGMGELSRLHQRLFYQTSLAVEVSAGLYVPKDPGMLYFQTEVDSIEKLQPAYEEILKELSRIAEEGPTQEELTRVLVNAESERLYATQSADGMAGRLGFLKFIMGDLSFDQTYLEDLKSVDANRIKEVAKKYLIPKRMSGVILLPKSIEHYDSVPFETLSEKWLGKHDSQIEKLESTLQIKKIPVLGSTQDSGLELIRLPSGLEVAYYYRPHSHAFSLHASVLGGLRLELGAPVDSPESDWGSSFMMALTWAKGTPSLDSKAISAITEGCAASIDGFSGRNSVGLQMTGLSKDWNTLSRLFIDVLLHPTFPENEIEHNRRVVADSIRSIDDHSSQLCSKLFLESLFEHHPYGKMTHGSIESLPKLTTSKLKKFHSRWVHPSRLVISLSGSVKKNLIEKWLLELEQEAKKVCPSSEMSPLATILEEPSLKAPRWVERTLGREQIHILVGGLGSQIDAEERYTIRLLQTLLGGQSGRLFIELREKKSLAYTVAPVSFEGMERGYIGTYIACSPNKKDEAIDGIKQVLARLAKTGPTAQEMNRAKEFYLGRRAMDLQGDSSLAAHFGLELLYKIPQISEEKLIKRIRSISAKEVQAVCRKYLVEPYMVTSVVG